MKHFLIIIIIFFVFVTGQNANAQKMGYVDFQYLISQVQATQDIQAELERLSRQWTQQIDAMRDTIDDLQKELETISIALSKTSRDMLVKNIEDRKQKLNVFQEQKFSPVSGDLYKKQQELLQPLIDKIKKSIDIVRIRQKYDVIFDISAGNPVSIDRKLDLTAIIIEEFSSQGLTLKGQAGQQKTDQSSGGDDGSNKSNQTNEQNDQSKDKK